MSVGYSFSRASADAEEMTLHDGDGALYATLRYPPDQPVLVDWVVPSDGLPASFEDLDAAKTWIADHADEIFGA
jgi:hypothetical protein